jgi:hypothetical protein
VVEEQKSLVLTSASNSLGAKSPVALTEPGMRTEPPTSMSGSPSR